MQRITITIEPALLEKIDNYMLRSNATNRSEALRDLIRRGLSAETEHPLNAECVGVISYTVDPTVRELSRRIPESRHELHDRTMAALSVPLDHTDAIEIVVMRGKVQVVAGYAHGLFLERGIRHGQLALIPVKTKLESHLHGEGEPRSHSHLRVQESF